MWYCHSIGSRSITENDERTTTRRRAHLFGKEFIIRHTCIVRIRGREYLLVDGVENARDRSKKREFSGYQPTTLPGRNLATTRMIFQDKLTKKVQQPKSDV